MELLIIDKTDLIHSNFKRLYSNRGVKFTGIIGSQSQALNLIRDLKPGINILDIDSSEMIANELLQMIKENSYEAVKEIIVIDNMKFIIADIDDLHKDSKT